MSRKVLRCPTCKEDTIAVIAEGSAVCVWCGNSWPVSGLVPKLAAKPASTRSSRPPPVEPDPKPPRRIKDPQAGAEKTRREARCRICGAPGVYYTDANPHGMTKLTRHHLVPRSQRGDDVDDNLVPLCGDGTTGCHSDIEEYRYGARVALRAHLFAPEVDYVVAKRGREWLEKSYPLQGV